MTTFTRALSLSDFTAALQQHKVDTYAVLLKLVRRVALEVVENVVVGGTYGPGTPIDTGFARMNWYLQLDSTAPKGLLAQAAKGAHFDTDLDIGVIDAAQLGQVIWLLNNAPYIVALEFGHSKQAPNGMVRVTLNAAPEIIAECAAAVTA